MEKRFSKDDVLRFLYKEMDPEEQDAFLAVLTEDEELWEEYEKLQAASEELNGTMLEPSASSLAKVRTFAKKSVKDGPVRPKRRGLLPGGKNRKLQSLHFIGSIVMVLFTTLTISMSMYAFQHTKEESVYSQDISRLQWDASYLDQKIEMAKMNMENLNQREGVLPVYNNTYRLVSTDRFSPFSKNVVLLNLY